MTVQMLTFLVLGALSGGFVNGLTGTGTALFALGFYLIVLDPLQAVAVVALMSVLAGLQGLWLVRKTIAENLRRLARFLVPGLLAVPLGVSLLALIDASALRLVTALFLIVYGAYFGLRRALPKYQKSTPVLDSLIGFFGGLFGGAAGVSGAIPSMWLSLRPWPKAEVRAVLQPFNCAVLSTTVGLLILNGAFDQIAMRALIVTVPTGLIAAQIGILVFKRLSDDLFRRLLIGLSFLMGVGLLAKEIF